MIDTTVLVKALVEPRRAKDDKILEEQLRLHKIAFSIVADIQKGKNKLCVPSIAIIETAAVVSRLTGSREIGKESADFVTGLSDSIIYDIELLDEAVEIATKTKASGFDVVFLACSRLTKSTLITDDIGMYEVAISIGIPSKLLRRM